MIRILHSVSVMDRGGQETFIMNVYRNIDRQKVQFDFLCSLNKKGDYDEEIRALGGKIIYLDIEQKGNKFSKYYYKVKNMSKFLLKLAPNYDIIHLHNYHAFSAYISVAACKKAGFKNIILHSHNSLAPRPMLHKIFKPLLGMQKITRYACSQEAGKWLHGKKKFNVIYNGIDMSKFEYDMQIRRELRSELGVEYDIVVGMVGRFNFQKNHLFALEVFANCVKLKPNVKLLLVGKGELEQEIREKIKQLNLQDNVILLGTRTDVDKLMSAFDVLFMPSIFEGLSLVLVEAQACRLPIVVSDVVTKDTFISSAIQTVNLTEDKDVWAKKIIDSTCADRNKITVDREKFSIIAVASDLISKYKVICEREQAE